MELQHRVREQADDLRLGPVFSDDFALPLTREKGEQVLGNSEQEATLRLIVQTVSGVCATRGDNFVLLEQIDVFMEEAGMLPKLNYNLQLTEWTEGEQIMRSHARRDTKVRYKR